ncbi:uncharacterized protein EI97DRAFT_84169 [Westerdykella ornata]|uniref:Uncharacterized protein n=1 Tax=Westerdykella ornata TaxID=318751 RepID=A0A6A6JFS4_WESOR|nr:uncharacterized protein EI97DRAFT_84169 [Westerdykella ornata]KAF2275003.1 hypothetical protein EI97DRAFT_84169 [Westerdykella ornata]
MFGSPHCVFSALQQLQRRAVRWGRVAHAHHRELAPATNNTRLTRHARQQQVIHPRRRACSPWGAGNSGISGRCRITSAEAPDRQPPHQRDSGESKLRYAHTLPAQSCARLSSSNSRVTHGFEAAKTSRLLGLTREREDAPPHCVVFQSKGLSRRRVLDDCSLTGQVFPLGFVPPANMSAYVSMS